MRKFSEIGSALAAIAAILALSGSGCLQKDSDASSAVTGPFDGTYLLLSRTCNGANIASSGTITRFVAKGGQGTFSDTLPDNCVIVTTSVLAYPAPGVVTSMPGKVTCTSSCSGAECPALPAPGQSPESFTYSVRGPSLQLTEREAHAGCATSETAAFTK